MSEHQPETLCRNCKEPLQPDSKFCPSCGQKNTDSRITVKELISEFFEVVLNIDNKIFRSLRALFIPGKLTEEYFNGRIRRYFHPIRMFFVLGLIFLLAMGIYIKQAEDALSNQMEDEMTISYGYQLAIAEADSLKTILKDSFPEPVAHQAMDSLVWELNNSPRHRSDSLDLEEILMVDGDLPLKVARRDIYEMSMDSLYERYDIEGLWHKLFLKQQIRFVKSGSRFVSFLAGNALWAIMLFMPFLAVLLKLLYVRRNQYYVEHLIFSFHIHSFLFLLLTLLFAILRFTGGNFLWLFPFWFVVYYFMAIRRVYKQTWFKTIFKGMVISILYLFFSILFMFAVSLISFLLF